MQGRCPALTLFNQFRDVVYVGWQRRGLQAPEAAQLVGRGPLGGRCRLLPGSAAGTGLARISSSPGQAPMSDPGRDQKTRGSGN